MKTLKNFFGTQETKKTINNFSNTLNIESMLMIKGGENADDEGWPPSTGSGSSTEQS